MANWPMSLRLPGRPLLLRRVSFRIIVGEADGAEADGDEQHDPDEAVAQIRPEQRAEGDREKDQHAAHGGRALLGDEMGFRPVAADRLALALLASSASG